MVNNSIGIQTEVELANLLFDKGYFVIQIPTSHRGQPFDLVALKDNNSIALDVKNVKDGDTFNLSRLEANQITSFYTLLETGNNLSGLAIKFKKGWRFLPSYKALEYYESGIKSLHFYQLFEFFE